MSHAAPPYSPARSAPVVSLFQTDAGHHQAAGVQDEVGDGPQSRWCPRFLTLSKGREETRPGCLGDRLQLQRASEVLPGERYVLVP